MKEQDPIFKTTIIWAAFMLGFMGVMFSVIAIIIALINQMAKKGKFKPPHSDKPKTLKKGNKVIALFLGTKHTCTVVEVIDKNVYKLESTTGTILTQAQWGQHLTEYTPWYIIKKIS